MALLVYGSTLSPFVRKVCVMLAEKGLEYTIDPISPPEIATKYPGLSPLNKIPAFRDTSLDEPNTLSDSSVICDYIEHKYPDRPLYPREPYQRARALWFEEYADSAMAACITRGLFFERVVKKFLGLQTDESVCEKTLTIDLPPLFDYLEAQARGRDYLVGDRFTIADISVATMLVNFAHVETFNAARWPALDGYASRMHERPSFKSIIEGELPILKQLNAA